MYSFFHTVMRMDHYLYTLERTLSPFQAGMAAYLQTSVLPDDADEHRSWLTLPFLIVSLFILSSLLCPAG